MRCHRWSLGIPLAAIFAAAPAGAQSGELEALSSAQAIFDSAEQLVADQRYEEACPKLEEVVRLVPSGVGAKMKLARCYEAAGRLASAWAAYVLTGNAASAAGQIERAKIASQRAAALKPRLSTLAIVVPPALSALPGLEIKRDGRALRRAEWSVAVAVDPGPHAVEVTAANKDPWRASEDVKGEASAVSIALPAELHEPRDGAPTPAREAPLPPDAARGPRGGVPAWAWAVGGAGVVLAGVSVGFLVDYRAAQANIDAKCPGGKSCSSGFDARGANARLYRDFGVFVGAGVAGVAAIGAAIAGIATAPKRAAARALAVPQPWIGRGAAGVGWGGWF
jgi:hypothetical protein